MADEDKAAEILRAAKAERRGPSRALWIATAVIGVLCAIGFGLLLLADRSTSSPPTQAVQDPGLGFGAGILVGVVMGIAIGYYVSRRESREAGARQSSRNTP